MHTFYLKSLKTPGYLSAAEMSVSQCQLSKRRSLGRGFSQGSPFTFKPLLQTWEPYLPNNVCFCKKTKEERTFLTTLCIRHQIRRLNKTNVMKPLSPFSLLAALIQFVDFGANLLSQSHQIYKQEDVAACLGIETSELRKLSPGRIWRRREGG